jgi:hypothetical protein
VAYGESSPRSSRSFPDLTSAPARLACEMLLVRASRRTRTS